MQIWGVSLWGYSGRVANLITICMFSYHLIKGGSLKDIWKVIFSKARFSHELKGRLTSAKEAIKCWEQLLWSYWRDPSDDSPSAILQCGPADESRAESDLSTLQRLKWKLKYKIWVIMHVHCHWTGNGGYCWQFEWENVTEVPIITFDSQVIKSPPADRVLSPFVQEGTLSASLRRLESKWVWDW